MPGKGIKGNLTHHVGPLPVWGWAAVAAGGWMAFQWWRNRQSSSSSQQQPTGSAYTADTSGAGNPYGGSYPYPIATRPAPPPGWINPKNIRTINGRTQTWHKTGAHSGYWR